MMNTETKEIIDFLLEIFTPEFEWFGKQNAASPLAAHLTGKTAHSILEDDIKSLGFAVIHSDKVAKKPEAAAIAETMAMVRIFTIQEPIYKNLDYLTDKILGEFALHPSNGDLSLPLSLRIIQQARGKQAEAAEALTDGFIELANQFILADGNLGDGELKFVQSYEKMLKGQA